MEVYSVDFDYSGAIGNPVRANVHVLAENAEDVSTVLQERFPHGVQIRVIVPAAIPLPVILDDYYRGMP